MNLESSVGIKFFIDGVISLFDGVDLIWEARIYMLTWLQLQVGPTFFPTSNTCL